MKEKVSIVRCPDYDGPGVYKAVKSSIALLGGMGRFVMKGERVLLKPNILSAKPPEAAVTTHPSVLRAIIRLVREAGARPFVGDSPALGSLEKAARRCGILDVCREEGVDLVDLRTPVVVENSSGFTFRRFEVAREAIEADAIINIPKLKTHAQMLLTMGIKNTFGCVPGKLKPQWHLSAGVDTDYFAGMILELHLFVAPRLTVLDAVVAMEGNGPGSGIPREAGIIAASGSAVALDTAVAASVLGLDTEKVPLLKAARRRNLPGTTSDGIEVSGDGTAVRIRDFKLPPLVHTNFAAGLPYFIGKRLRKALTSRPHVSEPECTLCRVCIGVCPVGVMEEAGRIRIDYDSCIRCYCCQEICPHGAITPRDGWLKRIIPGL